MDIPSISMPTGFAEANPRIKSMSHLDGPDFAALLTAEIAPGANARAAEPNLQTGKNGRNWLTTADGSKRRPGIIAGNDIDAYFEPMSGVNFDDPHAPAPFLLPSPENIAVLSNHAAGKLSQLLKSNGIATPPSEIRFDTYGQMVLPEDYDHAASFNALMAQNPAMQRELSTINALTSHYVESQESIRFSTEYSAARSKVAANAVVAKYSHLFSTTRNHADIALSFSPNGLLTPMADGIRAIRPA